MSEFEVDGADDFPHRSRPFMSSSKRRSSRGSRWNSNQICLAVVIAILGPITLMVMSSGFSQGTLAQGVAQAIGGMICPGIFVIIPAVILWKSRRVTHTRSMAHVVRSQAFSGPGYSDIKISNEQELPKICIRCGCATRRVTPLRYENAYTEVSPYDWNRAVPFAFLALSFSSVAALLALSGLWQSVEKRAKRRKAGQEAVIFKIPHCRPCLARHPIVQRHFDFHERTMILEVHPHFREGRIPKATPQTPPQPGNGRTGGESGGPDDW